MTIYEFKKELNDPVTKRKLTAAALIFVLGTRAVYKFGLNNGYKKGLNVGKADAYDHMIDALSDKFRPLD